jgi:polyhydroxyalkanoate synthesis regulator phasin
MKDRILISICALLVFFCLGDEKDKRDIESFKKAVESYASGPHFLATEHEDYVPQTLKKWANKCNLTQEDAVAEMCTMAREYRRLSEDTSEKVTERMRQIGRARLSAVLGFLGRFEDRSALPLFEEMTGASNGSTRVYAVRAYIKVAGADSVPFLKKMLNTVLSAPHERKDVFRKFGEELKKAKAGGKDLSEQYRFLLEAVTSGREQHCMVDEILCEMLPNYRTSVQREVFADQLLKSGNEYQKGLARNMKDEMEKTPKEKRKDFKAKGELLDSERKK